MVILQWKNAWHEFLLARTFPWASEQLPPRSALCAAVGRHSTDWPLLCASLTMSILPIIIGYTRMRRRFVAGTTLGAVKG